MKPSDGYYKLLTGNLLSAETMQDLSRLCATTDELWTQQKITTDQAHELARLMVTQGRKIYSNALALL